MERKLTADDYLEIQALKIQIQNQPKKKATLVKRSVRHFDSADYEKNRYLTTRVEEISNK